MLRIPALCLTLMLALPMVAQAQPEAIAAAAPHLKLSPADMAQFRMHNVTPDWINGWSRLGYRLSVRELVNTRIHGVSPDYARAMMGEVRDRPTVDQLIAMRIHGIRPGR